MMIILPTMSAHVSKELWVNVMFPEDDLHSLKADKQSLVPDQLAAIPLVQLRKAVRAPHEDQQRRRALEAEEDPQAPRELGAPAAPRRAGVPDEVVGEQGAEDHHEDDLQHKPREGEVDAGLAGPVGCRRHGAACGLDHQAHQVARDEDPVVEAGPEAGQLGAEVFDPVWRLCQRGGRALTRSYFSGGGGRGEKGCCVWYVRCREGDVNCSCVIHGAACDAY